MMVQVNVPMKGWAAQQSGIEYMVYTPLWRPIEVGSQGGAGGGWPIHFRSPSQQLGSEPNKLYVRFTTLPGYSKAAIEVYMVPDTNGDTRSMRVLVCTRAELGPDAPLPRLFSHTPHPLRNEHIDDYGDVMNDEYSEHSLTDHDLHHGYEQDQPEFRIPELPAECVYFDASNLQWSLDPENFTVPAPPSEIFDTLLGYEANATHSGSDDHDEIQYAPSGNHSLAGNHTSGTGYPYAPSSNHSFADNSTSGPGYAHAPSSNHSIAPHGGPRPGFAHAPASHQGFAPASTSGTEYAYAPSSHQDIASDGSSMRRLHQDGSAIQPPSPPPPPPPSPPPPSPPPTAASPRPVLAPAPFQSAAPPGQGNTTDSIAGVPPPLTSDANETTTAPGYWAGPSPSQAPDPSAYRPVSPVEHAPFPGAGPPLPSSPPSGAYLPDEPPHVPQRPPPPPPPAPPPRPPPPVVAQLFINNHLAAEAPVEYNPTLGPRIYSVSPETISAVVPEVRCSCARCMPTMACTHADQVPPALQIITVSGHGFSHSPENVRAWVGDRECYIRSSNDSMIVCRTRGGGTFGVLPVSVQTDGEYASGNVSVTGVFYIASISPAYGSSAGGAIVEIEGDGFADDDGMITTNLVSIGLPPAAPCRVLAASRTRITCQTEPAGRMHAGAREGLLSPLEVSVSGVYAQCRAPAACDPHCNPSQLPRQSVQNFSAEPRQCCPFSVPDPASLDPVPFIGDDQGHGADNCAYYYTAHATPSITAMGHDVRARQTLHMHGSMLNSTGFDVLLARMEESDVQRWINPYRNDSDPPEAVKLPDLWSKHGADHVMLQVVVRSVTEILAAVPAEIEPGTYLPLLWSAKKGSAEYVLPVNSSESLPLVRVHPHIDQVLPMPLTSSGGMITITGAGFPSDAAAVRLEGKGGQWIVLEASNTLITAYSPGWLYSDGPSLAVSIRGFADELSECEGTQEMCKFYAAAPQWNDFIDPEAYISGLRQEEPGSSVTIFIDGDSSVGTDYLVNRTVQVMFGPSVLPAQINTANSSVTLTAYTLAQLPASTPAGHEILVLVDGKAVAGQKPFIHIPLNISTISSSKGMTSMCT